MQRYGAKLDKSRSQPQEPQQQDQGTSSDDIRRLFSLSLSQIKKHEDFADFRFKPAPYNLRWVYGYNAKVGVINLNDNGSTLCFYAASNCGIIYNWTTNQMRILQGHRHMVTSIAADKEGRWLVTADTGSENIIIIWDSRDFFPQKTLFCPHAGQRVARVALSGDAKYLLTLGYSEKSLLHWWIWSYGLDTPHVRMEVDIPRDTIIAMDFNPDNSEQFLLLTKQDIWFGVSVKVFVMERGVLKETEDYELKVRKIEKKLHSDLGRLTCYTFVKDTCQILVATSRGGVLVYGYALQYQLNDTVDYTKHENLKFIKVLKVERNRINVIKSIDNVIVTGSSTGEIHFYDDQMKLLYWVHGFTVDTVKGLGFNISPRSYKIFDPVCKKLCLCWERVEMVKDPVTGQVRQKLIKEKLPSDATTKGKPFIVRDFIICTNNQGVRFVDFVTEKIFTIMDYRTSFVTAMTVHPEKPIICAGNQDGTVELVNFVTRKVLGRLPLRQKYKVVIPPKDDSIKCSYEVIIPELSVTCVRYSPSGLHLACGLNTGQLLFLDPTTMDILTKTPFKDTQYAIKEISFSCDSLTMAFSDIGKTVCVYKYDCENFEWNFIGKHRAHYKDINALFFLPRKNESGDWKLISIGADRIMVEYDIGASSDEYLEILSLDRMDQSAVPLDAVEWPTPSYVDPEENRTDLPMILVANDEFKYKIVNYDTTMTLATILGPRYENPVRKLKLITRMDGEKPEQYLLFATKYLLGLQKLPLDGNPWKHVALLGHPNQLTKISYRDDSRSLFTVGNKDACLCQWEVDFSTVDKTSLQGGIDLDPYYCIIENGRPGWLFQEIRDLFYYIQILCQGTFSPAKRRVKDYIPIESLPDLMRALGFFPSEYEVENLLVEAKYKVYKKCACTEIDFEEFVKLYLNHRPAFGDNIRKVKAAFKTFAKCRREEYFMHRDDFIDMLSDYGENFTTELSWYLLSILAGQSFEDRAQQTEEDFSFLPEKLQIPDILANILGIRDNDNDTMSVMSVGSQAVSGDSSEESEVKMKIYF